MKAVRRTDDGVAVVEVDDPPGSGELVRIRSASICGGDLRHVGPGCPIIGHELAGVREDGTAVVVEAVYGCMTCKRCQRGRYNLCPTWLQRSLGVAIDGGMAEQFRAPAERLVALPAGLALRDASLAEPAAVSWHGLRLGGTSPGSRVAVIGAGALGLLAVAGAIRMGARHVALEARHPHQREVGERLGASLGTGGRYDVVVEAAGTDASLARAVELVAPGGSVVVLGAQFSEIRIDLQTIFIREARLMPSLGYCAHEGGSDLADAAAMLAADPTIAAALITHRFPIEDAAEAFRVAGDRSLGVIRVVLEP
ncbi:alcohol dehydrogenase catalytic domain-containing protein [Frankia sp. AgB1.9]|uniref:zinc-dependent alcohol dehydrogenase n=1 Tax=unclassified Frankia TaxID=2632575 RepID=UPI0019333213|nr:MULTISPECIES: alcohol dehydrogenase catalytic domain-containing protein [unclassified Frankia]MBL7488480.1 alcohol dehydrogenase catalytic domain-containing protein [Frankia sp. AgW1.1]MBL7547263.1 alcohol dehydrogenase catalytic domain-containing protein [Frankia sp. AgB1.9]MBL7620833.1 alcohol dehydrogenase catalytic domain-containing protein [Frankia sp. AgB1.8]